MKKYSLFLCFIFLLVGVSAVNAEEGDTANQEGTGETDWRQELTEDQQAIKEERQQMKENAEQARGEEKQLKDQIKAAMDVGDKETANQLREQLRSTHQENVQQMVQDKKDIKINQKGYRQDLNDARQDGALPPRRDRDNNPPGPKGGAGTNWENKPGPQGGPGTSPDGRPWRDRDNNPPGPKGGAGTNWENKPGPQGGPGTSPDRKVKLDRDNNPPGPKGGAGTNWENKPGPRGGSGSSPNRKPVRAVGGGGKRK